MTADRKPRPDQTGPLRRRMRAFTAVPPENDRTPNSCGTPRERVVIALKGGKPDRVPILPIYDNGYLLSSIGRDPREYRVIGGKERAAVIERNLLRHDVDGIFVYEGTDETWPAAHTVEKGPEYWTVLERATGRRRRFYPDGSWTQEDGAPIRSESGNGESRIQTPDDIARIVPAPLPPAQLDAMGYFAPLRRLRQRHPDRYYAFPVLSPMVHSRGYCGGYVEMLTLLGSDPELFRRLLDRSADYLLGFLEPGKAAGGDAVWFASYFTGADTISPRTYADIVFPTEQRVCQAARQAGLDVIYWFLGDLLPVLDKVLELPINAIALEQGRKGYSMDPVEIRRRVGPRFCLIGFTIEEDMVGLRRDRIAAEARRQIEGAGRDGAFIAGTTIVSSDTPPEAVDFYFAEVRRISRQIREPEQFG